MSIATGPHDKEIAELFQISGSIIVRYNSLNWGICAYIVKCSDGSQDITQINKILDKPTKKGRVPRFEQFKMYLNQNGQMFMSESDLTSGLNRMREIRNSIGHWFLARQKDNTWGILNTTNMKVVDIKALHNEFFRLYSTINEPLSHLIP